MTKTPTEQDMLIDQLRTRIDLLERENERLGCCPLTGLPTRGLLDEALRREHARAARSGEEWAVVMVDVDHFKRFNDEHGHSAGDTVLRLVGDALRLIVRDADFVGRYGGEEFMFVAGSASCRSPEAFGERVRTAVEDMVVAFSSQITASVGVAVSQPGETVAEVVGHADVAMYSAKAGGRNACVVWGHPRPASHYIPVARAREEALRAREESIRALEEGD